MMNQITLEAKMKEKPLNRENFLQFLKEKVIRVNNTRPIRIAMIFKRLEKEDRYEISIGSLYPREEQEISLVHEVIHGHYGALGLVDNPEKPEIENLIEHESKLFYKENIDFVRNIYSKLASGIDPKDL